MFCKGHWGLAASGSRVGCCLHTMCLAAPQQTCLQWEVTSHPLGLLSE